MKWSPGNNYLASSDVFFQLVDAVAQLHRFEHSQSGRFEFPDETPAVMEDKVDNPMDGFHVRTGRRRRARGSQSSQLVSQSKDGVCNREKISSQDNIDVSYC